MPRMQLAALPRVFLLAAILGLVEAAYYDTYTGEQISEFKFRQYEAQNLVSYCALEIKECDKNERRRLDLSCNNLHSPQRGTTMTPFRRMLPAEYDAFNYHRTSSSGAPLPNARAVRTAVISDGRVASKRYTPLVTNAALAITGDITSIHDTANYVAVTTTCCAPGGEADPRCRPIRVPNDDVHLRRSNIRCLNLTKVITYQDLGCAPQTATPARINTSPPMLELSALYGLNENDTRKSREFRGGRFRADIIYGKEWPPTGGYVCVLNQPLLGETRCHDTPSTASNFLMGSNVMFLWGYRLHNAVARELQSMNPCWDDDKLFFETREIVIAFINQIWYYELYPAVLGYEYLLKNKAIYDTWGHVDDYDPKLEPAVSIEYVIGTRWFHTIQEGRFKLYDRDGKLINELNSVDLTLRTGILPMNRTIQGLTQGFFRQATAAEDYTIDPDMGERVLGGLQIASDVYSSDIMKGRDDGLPAYVKYRQICNLPVPKDFEDLRKWMPDDKVDALIQHYETVEDIDIVVGFTAEYRMEDAAMGPTLACMMTDQIKYWRRADRFWYENSQHPGAFTKDQLYQIRHMTMSRLICDQGDEVDSIQPWSFFIPGPGNEITDCDKLPRPSLEPWRDQKCKLSITPMPEKKPEYYKKN